MCQQIWNKYGMDRGMEREENVAGMLSHVLLP
jgi:hypothetical protein